MLKLYRMYFDCGRAGSLDGLFIAEESELTGLIGCNIDFGEVLGKHSQVEGELEEKDITVISEDQEKIHWLFEVIGSATISGYNPFNYYEEICDDCGNPVEDCDCGDEDYED